MRELDVKLITENVAEMCKEAAYYLPDDVYRALKRGRETEKSPVGQIVLDQIIKIFVPIRHFDIVDIGFDAVGAIIGILLTTGIINLVKRA